MMPNLAIYPLQGNFRVFTILKSKQGCGGVLPENLKRGPYAVVDERALIGVKSIFEQNFVTFSQILDPCIYEVTIHGFSKMGAKSTKVESGLLTCFARSSITKILS